MLTKTRSILTHVDGRLYRQIREDDGVITREVTMDIATFQELGEPSTITVSIEPGDRLNEDQDVD